MIKEKPSAQELGKNGDISGLAFVVTDFQAEVVLPESKWLRQKNPMGGGRRARRSQWPLKARR